MGNNEGSEDDQTSNDIVVKSSKLLDCGDGSWLAEINGRPGFVWGDTWEDAVSNFQMSYWLIHGKEAKVKPAV